MALLLAAPAKLIANTAVTGLTGGFGFTFNNQGFTVGYEFTVSQTITVDSLGFYDEGNDGLLSAHDVGIYDLCGTLRASGTVAIGTNSPLNNGYRYVSITPVVLAAGTYRIGAVVYSTAGFTQQDRFLYAVTSVTTDASVTYVKGVINNGVAVLQYPYQDATVAGLAEKCCFGPNFTFAPGGTPPGVPEVNLKGNGINIVDGSTNVSTADGTDFGNVLVTGGSVTNTFTIESLGTADLTLSGVPKVAVSGANASDFTVSVQPASPVATNSSTTFTIIFDPSAAGIRTATVSFANDDCNENPYDFAVQGAGVDYVVTTTGNAIVVTDIAGNGETLTISEPGAGTIKFAATGRAFRVDSGPVITGSAGTNSLTGITNITINLGNGNDTASFGTFAGTLPGVTVNGDAGNDNVNFTGNITFATDANLDVNLQNDLASPGVDTFTVSAAKTLAFTGTGGLDARVSQYVVLGSATITTVNGNINIEANQQATPTSGSFIGIDATPGALSCTGTGNIILKGKGGNAGGASLQCGVRLGYVGQGGCSVVTASGSITLIGQGGASSGQFYHRGVIVQGYSPYYASLTTGGGDINITGTGGGDGVNNGTLHIGVDLEGTGTARLALTAGGSGNINITGTGGNTRNVGGGNANTLTSSYGVFNNGLIQAGGNINITAAGGTGPVGFQFDNVGAYLSGTVKSTGGNVSITGAEGVGSSTNPPTGIISGTTQSGPSGNVSFYGNSVKLNGGVAAGANIFTITQLTNGVPINLGDTTDPIGGPLSLSDAELDRVTCGKLVIGDTNSGAIKVNATISRPASTVMYLNSGGNIAINTNGIDTLGGNLSLNLGTNSFSAAATNIDVSMSSSGTLSFTNGAKFAVGLNSATSYDTLNLVGKIDLTGVTLAFTGAYTPASGDSFMIITNDGTDAITNTFTGLAEGAIVSVNGVNKIISYVGGSGNDVVLAAPPAPEIGVQQPAGTDLVDNTGSISFGTGGVKTFTITNSGTASLILTNITKDGANPGDFTVGAPGSTNLAPGVSTTFTVTFAATATGARSAAIHIASNDADENPFDISLTGTGVAGAALAFDGADDAVATTGNFPLTGATPMTVEFWARVNSTATASGLLTLGPPTPFEDFRIRMDAGGQLRLRIFFGFDANIPYTVPDTGWHHFAFSSDGTQTRMYADGVLFFTAGAINVTAAPLKLGQDQGGSPLNGAMDEVRVWSRALCQDEIQAQRNCELAGTESGLVIYYNFNQGTAGANNAGVTTLTDIAGGDNNATLGNFALNGTASNWIEPGGVVSGVSCSPFTAPEINVIGNGVSIVKGDTTPSTGDDTDFGSTSVAGGTVIRTFTITNSGTGPLTVSSISKNGANAADFALGALTPASPVAASSSATFTVTFDPSAAGLRTATITITNNDCDEGSYDFAIQGTGLNTAPTLNVPASPVVAEATGAGGAVVNFSVTANDAEDGALTPVVTPASGSTFALGTNTVTASATDSGGLSVTNTFLVIVRDTTAPVITVPGDINAGAPSPAGALVNFSVSANDLVDGAVTASANPASGSTFPLGTNIVTVTAGDTRGNSATNTFLVIVTTAPTLYIAGSTELVTVFWQNVTGWNLQQNGDLLVPAGWLYNSNAALIGVTNYLMLTNPPGNQFYRLRNP